MTAPGAIMSDEAQPSISASDTSTPASRSATPLRVPPNGTAPRIIVIGGGLAGRAASVALESTGANVTLLEARRTLGGRAGSYTDPQTGEELDNCQHVLLGCCTNLQDFYNRVGVANGIRYDRAIKSLDARGRRYALRGFGNLPAPLHLGPSVLKFGALTWAERIAAGRAMLAMMRLDAQGRDALADVAFG